MFLLKRLDLKTEYARAKPQTLPRLTIILFIKDGISNA
jgi:hypothetical protein